MTRLMRSFRSNAGGEGMIAGRTELRRVEPCTGIGNRLIDQVIKGQVERRHIQGKSQGLQLSCGGFELIQQQVSKLGIVTQEGVLQAPLLLLIL